jgi:hypothetical protein
MTNPLKPNLFNSLTGFSACVVLFSAVTNPTNLSLAFTGAGALLAGASVASEVSRKREKTAAEAGRVAASFGLLYDQNKGMVIPEQLCVSSDISLDKAMVFLDALADAQNGEKVMLQDTVFFKFPHPENILDQLTANATAWAESRLDGVLRENSVLKQQLLMFQAAALNTAGAPAAIPQAAVPPPIKEDDPWQNLLR